MKHGAVPRHPIAYACDTQAAPLDSSNDQGFTQPDTYTAREHGVPRACAMPKLHKSESKSKSESKRQYATQLC